MRQEGGPSFRQVPLLPEETEGLEPFTMTATIVACLFSAIVGILAGWTARGVSACQKPACKDYRLLYERFRALYDIYSKRAAFSETYARQLEAELRVEKKDRMTTNSWRHRYPNYRPFRLAKDE